MTVEELYIAIHEQQLCVIAAAAQSPIKDKDWHILQQEVLRLQECIRDVAIKEREVFDFYDVQAERSEE